MPLKCVPLVAGMSGSDNKLDLRAVYRRKKCDNWGKPILDAEGREQWDVTGPLPLRRHGDYVRKGFEYITLADEQSLLDAAQPLSAAGIDWRQFANQERRTRSPFNPVLYADDTRSNRERELETLRDLIARIGPDAVLAVKRTEHAGWNFPPEITMELHGPSEPKVIVDAPAKPVARVARKGWPKGKPRTKAPVSPPDIVGEFTG